MFQSVAQDVILYKVTVTDQENVFVNLGIMEKDAISVFLCQVVDTVTAMLVLNVCVVKDGMESFVLNVRKLYIPSFDTI